MEWFKDMRPKKGEIGWKIYYRYRLARSIFLSKWTGAGKIYTSFEEAKEKASKQSFGHIIVRKVRFTKNQNVAPMKEKYQLMSGKWVKK